MQGNKILKGQEARRVIDEGVDLFYEVVASSLSPRGRNVGFFADGNLAMSIHDGVEIAERLIIRDVQKYWAIKTLLQASKKQVATAGDGTTVVAILACEIYKQAMRNIIAGTQPKSLIDDLLRNRDLLKEEIKKHSVKLDTVEQAVAIAKVSAQDPELGQKIGEIVYKMGIDGVVEHDISDTGETYVDFQEGCQFENGYISTAFVTDPGRMEATVENARILLTDKVLNNIQELLPLVDQFTAKNISNLVVIAQDVTDSALASFILTKKSGNVNILAVRAPYAGQVQKDFLDDLAILTGGKVIASEQGRRFDTATVDELGSARRVTATESYTRIVGGDGDKHAIKKRVDALKDARARALGKSEYEREKIKERLAKLSTGVAVVKVAAPLEIEEKNWIERAKDAIKATTVSLEEGYVPGGETIYLTARNVLDDTLGGRILYKAVEKPFRVLMENAGLAPDAWIEKITDKMGIDVIDGQYKDLLATGIIDPTLVSLEAITNAVSAAIVLFTTHTLILPDPENEKDKK